MSRSSSAASASSRAGKQDDVREYTTLALPRSRPHYQLSLDMFDARSITQVRSIPFLYVIDSSAIDFAVDPQAQKQAMIKALNEHRINTIVELRRVERVFASLGSSDVTQPMTAACTDFHLMRC